MRVVPAYEEAIAIPWWETSIAPSVQVATGMRNLASRSRVARGAACRASQVVTEALEPGPDRRHCFRFQFWSGWFLLADSAMQSAHSRYFFRISGRLDGSAAKPLN